MNDRDRFTKFNEQSRQAPHRLAYTLEGTPGSLTVLYKEE